MLCLAEQQRQATNQAEPTTLSEKSTANGSKESTPKRKPSRRDRAARNSRALYFSTFSEPHDKLIEHINQFSFYNQDLFIDYIRLLSLTSVMDEGLDKVADLIVSSTRQEQAGFIAIDGFQALEGIAQNSDGIRRFLYRLSAQLSLLGATLVVALERSLVGAASEGDLTVADGIIGLYSRIEGVREYRRMEVRKMRGMARLTGLHTYDITEDGMAFYPRLDTLTQLQLTSSGAGSTDRRLSTGLPELDKMLGGGLPSLSSTLVAGSPGVGKTLLGLNFLMEGTRQGQKGLYLGFHESPAQLTEKARQFGLDLKQEVKDGQIILLSRSAFAIEPDYITEILRQNIEQKNIERVVIDDWIELDGATQFEKRTHDYIAALITYFKSRNVTTVCNFVVNKVVATDLDLERNASGSPGRKLAIIKTIGSE